MSLSKEIKMKGGITSPGHETLLNIIRTANCIDKYSNLFFAKFGITDAQFNIMIIIEVEGKSLTQVEISERMISSRSNVTGLLDKLEKKRLVCRKKSSHDRRVFLVELTEQGRRLVKEIEPRYALVVSEIMESLSDKDSKAVSLTLVRLRQRLADIRGGFDE